jgi:putative Ig domain-containing protein
MTRKGSFCISGILFLLFCQICAAQVQSQPLQSFGYIGVADYLNSHPGAQIAADWDYLGVDPPPWDPNVIVNLQSTFQRLQSNIGPLGQPHPVKAFIDLGGVFWIRDFNSPDPNAYKLRDDAYDRWFSFINTQGSYFYPTQIGQYVFAFTIANEPTFHSIAMSDVQWAANLVKSAATGFPNIPTAVVEAGNMVADQGYLNRPLADFVDWWGIDFFGIHPSADSRVSDAMSHYRTLMAVLTHSQKKLFYTIDGYYDSADHACIGKSEMPGLGQAWFTMASTDPDAILTGVFLLPDLDANAIGSASLGADVMEKHAHMWQAIQNRKAPAYQSHLENANCQTISGWAWDSNQPDSSLLGSQGYITNPAYLDLVVDSNFVRTFSAKLQQSTVSVDPVVGNGFHGFSVPLPDIAKNGVPHTVHIQISGTTSEIAGSPRQVTCSNPNGFPGTQLANGSVNVPYSQSIWPFPNPQDFSFSLISGRLPAGLSINSLGMITGTPTASGSLSFLVRASLAGQQGSCSDSYANNIFDRVFSITINP